MASPPWPLPGKRGAPRGAPEPSLAGAGDWLLRGRGSDARWQGPRWGREVWRGLAAFPVCTGAPGSAPHALLQVLPHVLHVRQPGVRGADAAADTQLAATLPLLPLVSWDGTGGEGAHGTGHHGTPGPPPAAEPGTMWGRGALVAQGSPQDPVLPGHESLPGADVHLLLVLRPGRHADRRPHLQIHRIPRVRAAAGPPTLPSAGSRPSAPRCGLLGSPGSSSWGALRCGHGALWPEPWASLTCCWFPQGGEGVGRRDPGTVPERGPLRPAAAGGGSPAHQELEVSSGWGRGPGRGGWPGHGC